MSSAVRGFEYLADKKLWKLRFTEKGKRYSVYGKTQKECEAKRTEKLEMLKQHMHLENQKITLSSYYDLWVEEQAKEIKPSTIWNYEKSWKHIKPYLGGRKIVDLVKGDVLYMQKEMKRTCSPDTINRATKLLNQILKSAIVDRIINYNPCMGIKKLRDESPKATETIHRALTEEETEMFFESAKDSYYYELYRFLINTGCRIGEATALSWFDVNFKRSEIKINKTTSRISNTEYIVSDSPKTDSSIRTIPITPEIKDILEKQRKRNYMLFGSSQPFVFPNRKNQLASHNTVDNFITDIIRKINVSGKCYFAPFSVHGFRDTFATRCIEQNMSPHTLKALMGHSSLKMTMDLYAQVLPNTKKEELEKIRIVL